MKDLRESAQHATFRFRRPNLYRLSTRERVGVVFDAPSEMSIAERLFLYSMVRGSRPQRILEIGTNHGGSALIMTAALQDAGGVGTVVGIDPAPRMTVPMRKFSGRFQLIKKPSPEAIDEARVMSGGPFDLVLIDGLHIYDQAKKDLLGVLPHLAQRSYVLLHDAFHFGIMQAVREAIEQSFVNGGGVTTTA